MVISCNAFQKESANDDLSVANLTSLNEITQQSSDEICHFIIFRCLHFRYLFVDVEDFFASSGRKIAISCAEANEEQKMVRTVTDKFNGWR
ncbi:hypothetical protein QQG55_4085 [Brugia pahangi]